MTESEKRYHSWTAQMQLSYYQNSKLDRKEIEEAERKYNCSMCYATVGPFHWALYSIRLLLNKAKEISHLPAIYNSETQECMYYGFYATDNIRYDSNKRYKLEGIFCIMSLVLLIFHALIGIIFFCTGSFSIPLIVEAIKILMIISYLFTLVLSLALKARRAAHFINAFIFN